MEMEKTDDTRDVLADVGQSWGWLLAFAVLTLVLGILIMAWPSATVKVVAFLFGFQLFILGIFSIVRAFTPGGEGARALFAIMGVLAVLVGIFVLRNLFQSVVILVVLLGVYWVVHGIIDVVAAIDHKNMPARGLNILIGVLSFIAGVIVLAWPSPTLLVLVWVLGLWLVLYGVIGIVAAFMVRKAPKVVHT
jgi:uncharacterized membrane protein HdeD (DUF308 family)